MITLFMLSLAAQDVSPTLTPRLRDTVFECAVEDWIYRTGTVTDFRTVLSPDLARLVGCLGCDRYDCRQLATEGVAAHPQGLRAAIWGVHATDPDVGERSLGFLRRFLVCSHCGGDALCPVRVRDGELSPYHPCDVCDVAPFLRNDGVFHYSDPRVDYYWSRCLNCNGTGNMLYLVSPFFKPCRG